ncbi:MAG: WGR domain-containing protein [Geminicoccaceae bacterium]|nr:MAG: WGR domain-containing protein [Geminicoccaceae bacterium]
MKDGSSLPPLDFVSIDADARRFRRYRLWLQPDLFGRVSLVREWGRVGQPGTVRIATYSRGAEAAQDFHREVERRLQRGYRPTPATAVWLDGGGA